MRRLIWLALMACGSSSGTKQTSEPRVGCDGCSSTSGGPVSTFSKAQFDSSWQGECWRSTGDCGGPIPTPGTPPGCGEETFRCHAVDHEVQIRCENDACSIAKPSARADSPGVQTSDLVFTKPGNTSITVMFVPERGNARSERMQADVRRPDRAIAHCLGGDVLVTLYAGDVELGGQHSDLVVTMPDGTPCTRAAAGPRDPNRFRCPDTPASLHVKAPDAELDATMLECS